MYTDKKWITLLYWSDELELNLCNEMSGAIIIMIKGTDQKKYSIVGRLSLISFILF